MRRRHTLIALGMLPIILGSTSDASAKEAASQALRELEASRGGRLGVCALDPITGRSLVHRGDERFALCSTFKFPLAALILKAARQGELAADAELSWDETDQVPHMPVTGRVASRRMRIIELAEAAQTTSDNLAANLLLRELGGPMGFTQRLRALGDAQTRLDRWEPAMNLVPPGEVRDTTTPSAMARLAARCFEGDSLDDADALMLRQWLIKTDTGRRRLRAGFPRDWVAGDKTGTALAEGMANKYNDVAVVWQEQRVMLTVAAYYEAPGQFAEMRPKDEAVLAAVGEIVGRWWDEAHTPA